MTPTKALTAAQILHRNFFPFVIQLHLEDRRSREKSEREKTRSQMCLHVCWSLSVSVHTLCVCICVYACVRSIQVTLPAHINQEAVLGRIISGLPQASLFWLFFSDFHIPFLHVTPSFHSRFHVTSVCVCMFISIWNAELKGKSSVDLVRRVQRHL